ncbi:hypothetical protein GIB67_006540 [Kingdonia uniflora]|uniref:Uncharacterized protein n=1 Tax=Kingdonia uniflora TaxID=39325 RepID=A0A7J7LEP3_9MAGN|nr:hypothetical protein GIB67_006540 [Kingdonia uniflora]
MEVDSRSTFPLGCCFGSFAEIVVPSISSVAGGFRFSFCYGNLWEAELEVRSPVIGVGLAA